MKTREQKQEEAGARQVAARARTPEEQLQRLHGRGVFQGREYDKLRAMIENGQGKLTKKAKTK